MSVPVSLSQVDRFGLWPYRTSHDGLVDHPAGNRDHGRNPQVYQKAALRNRLPPDKRSERDAEKECTVVPGENRRALSRKIFCKPDLLSREKQLCRSRGRGKSEGDEHPSINRQLDQQKTGAKSNEAYAAC